MWPESGTPARAFRAALNHSGCRWRPALSVGAVIAEDAVILAKCASGMGMLPLVALLQMLMMVKMMMMLTMMMMVSMMSTPAAFLPKGLSASAANALGNGFVFASLAAGSSASLRGTLGQRLHGRRASRGPAFIVPTGSPPLYMPTDAVWVDMMKGLLCGGREDKKTDGQTRCHVTARRRPLPTLVCKRGRRHSDGELSWRPARHQRRDAGMRN